MVAPRYFSRSQNCMWIEMQCKVRQQKGCVSTVDWLHASKWIHCKCGYSGSCWPYTQKQVQTKCAHDEMVLQLCRYEIVFICCEAPRGGTQLFSGTGVRPGFPKCGACELIRASERGGLWTENFQIWGLVNWKFSNLGAYELKFGQKMRLWRLKMPIFLKRGSCELTLLLEMGPLRTTGEAWKGGL